MIRNATLLRKFERRFQKTHKINIQQALKLMEGLYHEARAHGRRPKNILEGLEVDIRFARALNGV